MPREHGISSATFYTGHRTFGGMDASLISRLKVLQDAHRQMKKRYADAPLRAELLQDALAKE